jgi:hypothetical protein
MSRNAHEGKKPHTYIDDLESFYFVICWILMVYSGPHKVRAPPKEAAWWDLPEAFIMKQGHFLIPRFQLPIDPWFGPSFEALATRLFDFLRTRGPHRKTLVPPDDPKRDYDMYLDLIRQCIFDMEAEDLAAEGQSSTPGKSDVHTYVQPTTRLGEEAVNMSQAKLGSQ